MGLEMGPGLGGGARIRSWYIMYYSYVRHIVCLLHLLHYSKQSMI